MYILYLDNNAADGNYDDYDDDDDDDLLSGCHVLGQTERVSLARR